MVVLMGGEVDVPVNRQSRFFHSIVCPSFRVKTVRRCSLSLIFLGMTRYGMCRYGEMVRAPRSSFHGCITRIVTRFPYSALQEQIAREFQEIDIDRNGGLDNIELRRCQELDECVRVLLLL